MKTKAARTPLFILVMLMAVLFLSVSTLALEREIVIEADSVVLNKAAETASGGYYTVEVPIRISKSSGFVSLRFYVYHPESIELVGWTEGEVFPPPTSANLTPPIDMNATENGILVFYSEGMSVNNNTETGTLITLEYKVPSDVALGELDIELVMKDAYGEDGDRNTNPDNITSACTVKSGKITVTYEPICGDVNVDTTVNTLDVVYLARYLGEWVGYTDIDITTADINGDGEITLVDLVCLSRHIAGWTDYADLPIENNQ